MAAAGAMSAWRALSPAGFSALSHVPFRFSLLFLVSCLLLDFFLLCFLLLLRLGCPVNGMDQREEDGARWGSLIFLCVSSRDWLMLWEEHVPPVACATLGMPPRVLYSLFLSVKWIRSSLRLFLLRPWASLELVGHRAPSFGVSQRADISWCQALLERTHPYTSTSAHSHRISNLIVSGLLHLI